MKKTKTKTIKILQSAISFYQTMGIYPPQVNANNFFNSKLVFFLVSLILAFISTTACFLFEAKSTIEHIETFYAAITTLSCAGCLLINRCKIESILELKQNVEELIQKSEFIIILWKLNWTIKFSTI